MTRSVWKGPYVDAHLLKKVQNQIEAGTTEMIKTWSRRSTILPFFVGFTFSVYNGRKFLPVTINEDMVGRKLGEFSFTRKSPNYSGNKKATRS